MRHRLAFTLLLAWTMACQMAHAEPASRSTAFQYGEPPLPGLGGPLALTRHDGKPFSLRDVHGSPVLVFFGFTQCASTCSVAMMQAQRLLARFQSRQPPVVLFVTLDPLSDSPAALAQYLAHFDPRIIGLTGTPPQIEKASRQYGVATQQSATAPLEHSSRWYLLDADMQLVRVYKMDTPESAMAQDIARASFNKSSFAWERNAR